MRERGAPGGLGPRAPAVLLFLLLAGCAFAPRGGPAAVPGAPRTESLRVHVSHREAPVSGARVEFFRSPAGRAEAPAAVGVTGGDGIALVELPPGRFFLVARWTRDGDYSRRPGPGDRYAWFGGNPVYARGGGRDLFVGIEEILPPPDTVTAEPGMTGAAGVVFLDGVPVEGVHVSAYAKADGAFRDLGFAASSPTGADGGFVLDLPPGEYYLVARKREGGGVAGPLRKGDLFGYFPGNPVTVPEGGVVRASIAATRLKMRNIPSYASGYPAAATIEGRIVDRSGNPVRGAYAALYDNPDLLNRPVFLSDRTGGDGKYLLPVPVPGRYYLGARSGYGGSPSAGDVYGRYEGNAEHAVTIRDGDRLAIDLTVAVLE